MNDHEWRGSINQIIVDTPLPRAAAAFQHGFVEAKEQIISRLREANLLTPVSTNEGHEIRDSKDVLDWYGHPSKDVSQGVFTMLDAHGKLHWCPSGNEIRRAHESNPAMWLTGPIYLPLSKEDHERFLQEFYRQCDNF